MISDRPSQISPMSTPGMIQLESGLSCEKTRSTDYSHEHSTTWLLGMLMRTGIADAAELRIGFEYANETHGTGAGEHSDFGVRNLSIGTKLFLLDAGETLPTVSLFANAHLPFGHDGYRPRTVIPGLRLQADYDFNQRAMLTCNLGSEWDIGAPEMLVSYTTTLAVPINGYITAFGDFAGQFDDDDDAPSHACDLGLTISLHDHMQLDLAGGIGLSSTAPDYFFSSGISYRIQH